MWDKEISLIWMVETWNGYLIVAEAQVVKRAHFKGEEARQVSLDDGRNRFFPFFFFF